MKNLYLRYLLLFASLTAVWGDVFGQCPQSVIYPSASGDAVTTINNGNFRIGSSQMTISNTSTSSSSNYDAVINSSHQTALSLSISQSGNIDTYAERVNTELTFTSPIRNLTFNLNDLDAGDRVRIKAFNPSNTPITYSPTYHTFYNTPSTTQLSYFASDLEIRSGGSNVDSDESNLRARATIDFGTILVSRVVIEYYDTESSGSYSISLVSGDAICANPDVFTGNQGTAFTTASIFANDFLNGAVPTSSTVSISGVTGLPSGASINSSGVISVPNTVSPGIYSINYTICSTSTPSICSSSTVAITILPDSDSDGVNDTIDLDDDNDGILDIDEDCIGYRAQNTSGSWLGGTASTLSVTSTSFTAQTNVANYNDGQNRYWINQNGGGQRITRTATASHSLTYSFSPGVPASQVAFFIDDVDPSIATGSTTVEYTFLVNGAPSTLFNSVSNGLGFVQMVYNGSTGKINLTGLTNDQYILLKGNGSTLVTSITLTSTGTGSGDAIAYSLFGYRVCDTDGDLTPDYLDLDSDGDGCFDAIEGDENVVASNLSSGSITGTVNTSGVPNLVNSGGAADTGGDVGQGLGQSQVVNATATTPTFTTTAATCASAGTVTMSNFNSGLTYTFSPSGPTVGVGGAISGSVAGTVYTVTSTSAGGCVSGNGTFTRQAQLATPAAPTITTTAATCSAAGTATVSNYVAAQTYTFSPTGPTVGAGGVISNATAGTPYTVTTTNASGCTSGSSASFTRQAQLATPAAPTITTTAATCSAAGTATVSNYVAAQTYTFSPTGPTVGAGGVISNATAGTPYTVTTTNASGCTSGPSASFTRQAQLAAAVGGTATANQLIYSGTTPAALNLSGHTGTIQWQVSSDNVSFTNVSGATATPFSPGTLTATRYYRALVTSVGGCTAISNVVTITVCQSGTNAPLLNNATNFISINNAYTIPCGSTTANLSAITASNKPVPASVILTWHSATPATNANRVNPATAITGATRKFYAAFYDNMNDCYSGAKEITIYAPICATNDNYTATPILAGVGGTLPTIFGNDTYNGTIVSSLPAGSVDFNYSVWTTGNATVDSSTGVITIPATTPSGVYTYTYELCDLDPDGMPNSNCSYASVTFSVVPDSDGDGVADPYDLDDDNDGILDTYVKLPTNDPTSNSGECNIDISQLYNAFGSGSLISILPSDFGLALNAKNQNVTADLSAKFGFPANSGALVISISNASVHPTVDTWWTKNGQLPSDWNVTGELSAFLLMAHDVNYYGNDSKTFHIYDQASQIPIMAPGFENQDTVPGQWATNTTATQKTLTNLDSNTLTMENANWRFANMNFGYKSFGFSTTTAFADPTYGVMLYLECDLDADGIPNRLDLDTDNDGCVDAVEGNSYLLNYKDLVGSGGTVSVGTGSSGQDLNLCGNSTCVNSQGVPLILVGPNAYSVCGVNLGQEVGAGYANAAQSCSCFRAGDFSTLGEESMTGVSDLEGFANGWPYNVPNGYIVMESRNSGFVITRVNSSDDVLEPVEGMILYDITDQCVELYDGTVWSCLEQSCVYVRLPVSCTITQD